MPTVERQTPSNNSSRTDCGLVVMNETLVRSPEEPGMAKEKYVNETSAMTGPMRLGSLSFATPLLTWLDGS